jgi:N-acetylmuramate 1-kinase
VSNPDRDHARTQFLADSGWADAQVEALPADMSFRRYFRLEDRSRRALLMDSPPDKENIRPYAMVDRHLINLGLSAPRIESLDEEAGFAIIEDFGNDTYSRLIADGQPEQPLYELAVDVLATLHRHPGAADIAVPIYDTEKLILEVVELTDWYYPQRYGVDMDASSRTHYVEAWEAVFANLPPVPHTLILRDYHVDNLMILEGRDSVARCGLLDFQDAVLGHPAYDLMSLLEDARRDISDELSQAMYARYRDQMPDTSGDDFGVWYAVLGAQRHAKVAGRFVRFLRRDGNPRNLVHVPRVMRLLNRSLSEPALAPVKAWLDEHMPGAFTEFPDLASDQSQQREHL